MADFFWFCVVGLVTRVVGTSVAALGARVLGRLLLGLGQIAPRDGAHARPTLALGNLDLDGTEDVVRDLLRRIGQHPGGSEAGRAREEPDDRRCGDPRPTHAAGPCDGCAGQTSKVLAPGVLGQFGPAEAPESIGQVAVVHHPVIVG